MTLAPVPDLTARGKPGVLAQVVTNLLANGARHAPGAAVTVTGRVDGAGSSWPASGSRAVHAGPRRAR